MNLPYIMGRLLRNGINERDRSAVNFNIYFLALAEGTLVFKNVLQIVSFSLISEKFYRHSICSKNVWYNLLVKPSDPKVFFVKTINLYFNRYSISQVIYFLLSKLC